MRIAKDSIRSKVRVGFDGKVYKTFRGTGAGKRFANEIRALKVLEERGCDFVPRFLDADEETLTLVTTNCGHPAPSVSKEKADALFDRLKNEYGIIHDDPYPRNVTYHPHSGKFCVIDFELCDIVEKEESVEGFTISWCGLTHDGTRKKGNDDALAAFSSEQGWAREQPLEGSLNLQKEGIVLAVSDGMGGVRGGDVASKLAVNELRRFLPARMGDFKVVADPLSVMESAVVDLHNYVVRMGKAHPQWDGMGATLECGLFHRREMHFAHVGDSKIYRFRKDKLEQLSTDHSRVGAMFRDGKINERQARSHPARSSLNQVIGARANSVTPQVGTIHTRPGDWFLFCSDGLVDGLWNKNIHEEFEKGEREGLGVREVATSLLDRSVQVSGKDDTTLFVARIGED